MKRRLLFLVYMVNSLYLFSQGCLPNGIVFNSQNAINQFAYNYPYCTVIEGDVEIFNFSTSSPITNLNGLLGITSIEGELKIRFCDNLINLDGLDSLKTVHDGLRINHNQNLMNIDALSNLDSIGKELYLSYNVNLTNLDGLQNISSIGTLLYISSHPSLTDIEGLSNLTQIGGELYVSKNKRLTNLHGLHNLVSINGNLSIINMDSLLNLQDLISLQTLNVGAIFIKWNDNLLALDGIDNIDPNSFYNLQIQFNPKLAKCHVQSICEHLSIQPDFGISNNAYGCNGPIEVLDYCNVIGVDEISEDLLVRISPNPVIGETINIDLNKMRPHLYLRCFNNTGQKVYQGEICGSEIKISVNNWQPGTYFLVLTEKGNPINISKIIII